MYKWLTVKLKQKLTRCTNSNAYSGIVRFSRCLCKAINFVIDHDGVEHAGYIAFLLMLGIFPFLVFFVAILGWVDDAYFSRTLAISIIRSAFEWMGSEFTTALRPRIEEITTAPPHSFLTLAIISGAWSASAIFDGLRTALNKAYFVKNPPTYIFRRLLSILEFVLTMVCALVIVFVLTIVPDLFKALPLNEKIKELLILSPRTNIVRLLFSYGLLFFMTSYLYLVLPHVKQKLRDTFPGSILTLLGWHMFSLLFKYYITSFPQIHLIYGSIAGVIIALVYFYACSLIFLCGAELNYQFKISLK